MAEFAPEIKAATPEMLNNMKEIVDYLYEQAHACREMKLFHNQFAATAMMLDMAMRGSTENLNDAPLPTYVVSISHRS